MEKHTNFLSRFWIQLILSFGLITMVLPFFWMISSSLKTREAINSIPPQWIPFHPTVNNYIMLFKEFNFFTPFRVTVIVAIGYTVLTLLITSMAGYTFAKFTFPGRDKIFGILLATMMIPSTVILIPLFLIVKNLGWLNSYQVLILPPAANIFNIFFMRQYIKTIPDELIEAARIDGAKEWFIFSRIILPLSKPALATLGLLSFIGQWNSFLWPLIVSTDSSMYTLTVAIYTLFAQNASLELGMVMAGTVIVVIPLIILFIFAQKYLVQTLSLSGINR